MQSHSSYLARARPEDPPGTIKTLLSLFTLSPFLKWEQSPGESDLQKAAHSGVFISVCSEENREICTTTELRGTHQPGGSDLVRVRAQQL